MGFTLNQHEQEKQIKRLQQKEDHDTTDYESLENLPEINGVELKGNKSLSDLGIQGDSLEAAGGEILTLDPTSEGLALLTKAYGMSVQDGTPTPSSPVDIESAKVNLTSTHGQDSHNVTTDLTLRAIEATSSDAYNLVRDGKYYIADTLDYTEDDGFVVTRRIKHLAIDPNDAAVSGLGTNNQRFSVPLNQKCINMFLSNRFVKSSYDLSMSFGEARVGGDSNFIVMGDNEKVFETLNDFKTWLTNNPAIFDLICQTPTTEPITTAQALALLGLKTYDESTTISSQAEPACTVAVEYAKEKLGAVALTAYNKAVADGLNIAAITPHILPDAPTTDGSYNLNVTVTSGEAAYRWEAVTP